MADYSRVFGSQFPETAMELTEYKDIGEAPANVQILAQNYYELLEATDFIKASALLEENWNVLSKYYFGMEILNKLEEEIYNTQIFAQKNNTVIIGTQEPDISTSTSTVPWLKPLD